MAILSVAVRVFRSAFLRVLLCLSLVACLESPTWGQTIFDFDTGSLDGWSNTLLSLEDTPGGYIPHDSTEGGRILSLSGAYTVRNNNFGDRDSAHSTLVFSSPSFTLDGSGDLSARLLGGQGGASSAPADFASLPSASSGSGFMGIALRRVSDGAYLLSDRRTSNAQNANWEDVGWTAGEIAAATAGDAPGETYKVDLIDSFNGGWGWTSLDTVSVPGSVVPTTELRFQEGRDFGFGAYNGTRDTRIWEPQPDTDFATEDRFGVDGGGTGPNGDRIQGLIRFEDFIGDGPGQIPAGTQIESATLTLNTVNSGNRPNLHQMLTSWEETDTWNSLGGGVSPDGVEASVGRFQFLGNNSGRVTDITQDVQGWINGQTNNGWLMTSSGTDGWDAASSENGDLGLRPTLTVSLIDPNPQQRQLEFDFDDGSLQGWGNQKVSLEDTPGGYIPHNATEGNRVLADSGEYTIRNNNFGDRDSAHETLLFSSPAFTLTGQGDLTAELLGGQGGAESAPENVDSLPSDSSGSGFMGIALRRVSDGAYVLSDRRSSNAQNDNWETVGWTAGEIAAATAGDAPGETYQLDLIDSFNGGWGWTSIDSVSVPGELAPVTTLSFQEGVDDGFGVYSGTRDTRIWEPQPDTDFATEDRFGVDGGGTGPNGDRIQGLIRFEDIIGDGPGQIPEGALIQSATLTLDTVNDGNRPNLHQMLIGWEETDTWNSLGGGVSPDGIEASIGKFQFLGNDSGRVIDVTAYLQAWVNGQTNYGWLMTSSGTDGWDAASSEFPGIGNRPRLEVSFTLPATVRPIPEPAALPMCLLGLAGVLAARRRR